MRRKAPRGLVFLGILACACSAPGQTGEILVLPGATQRLILAMRLGYAGVGDAKPPARVRRAVTRDDFPTGPAVACRPGDWLLENTLVTVVIGHADGSPRGGQLLDMGRPPQRYDQVDRVDTIVAGRRVRYASATTGTDDVTGTAYVQVTGRAEGAPSLEVMTRYDLAPDLAGVVVHTSLVLAGQPLAGPIAVGDSLSFPGGLRVVSSAHDFAAFGSGASYALEPLAEAPLVVSTSATGASVGLAPELVVVGAPEEPFIYSRVFALLERADDVALAVTRAAATGLPLGEVELEVVALPQRVGQAIDGGRFSFRRAGGAETPMEMPVVGSSRPGDKRLAKLPVGRWEIGFEGGGYHTAKPTAIQVAARVLTPVKVQVKPIEDPAGQQQPSTEPAPGPTE